MKTIYLIQSNDYISIKENIDRILKTNNLTKKYKRTEVLNNLNMNIETNSIYGLIGKNGAGKTTLIRIITGLQNPTKGNYSLYGVSYQDKEIKIQEILQ